MLSSGLFFVVRNSDRMRLEGTSLVTKSQ